jgi:hypothetical protein
MAKKRKKKQPEETTQKRQRTTPRVTFWTHPDVAGYFESILNGTHLLYVLDLEADTNLDYDGRRRCCWRVRHREGHWVDGLLSTTTYRLSLEWSVSPGAEFWGRKMKEKVKAALPSVDTKYKNVSRHRCPNSWCCRPDHIQIGHRAANEMDKHFHYFLNNVVTGKKFMDTFKEQCREQRVWGIYPPD